MRMIIQTAEASLVVCLCFLLSSGSRHSSSAHWPSHPSPTPPAAAAGEHPDRLPSGARLEQATGLSAAAVEAAQATVRGMLEGDTSAISCE